MDAKSYDNNLLFFFFFVEQLLFLLLLFSKCAGNILYIYIYTVYTVQYSIVSSEIQQDSIFYTAVHSAVFSSLSHTQSHTHFIHTLSVSLCCLSPKFGSSICVVSKVPVWSGSQIAVLGLKGVRSVQTASDVCVLGRLGARWI